MQMLMSAWIKTVIIARRAAIICWGVTTALVQRVFMAMVGLMEPVVLKKPKFFQCSGAF